MARQDRNTLRRYFQKGALPSQDHFNDLIDSMLNMRDEGFSKSPEHGFEISPIENNASLISFFSQDDDANPSWTFRYSDLSSSKLELSNLKDTAPILTFDGQHNRIGINTNKTTEALEVGGFVKSHGVLGIEEKSIPADGEYHDVLGNLKGCHAFEIVAGVGATGTGIYSLAHVIAINTHYPVRWYDQVLSWCFERPYKLIKTFLFKEQNPSSDFLRSRRGIRIQQSSFGKGKIKVRWSKRPDFNYTLQIKSVCDCNAALTTRNGNDETEVHVRYHIKRLWQDEEMQACQSAVADASAKRS